MRRIFTTLALAVAFSTAAASARAFEHPELDARAGGTGAVTGAINGGGLTLSLAALWPVEDWLSFGAEGFADDLGSRLGRLQDPHDGTDLGAVELGHRWTMGGAWRFDARLPLALPGHGSAFGTGTWGFWRIRDDQLGRARGALSSVGWSLGGGVRRPISTRHALGISVRYHRLLNDTAGRYLSAALDWSWGIQP